jgi:hypothetical protein
VADAVHDKFVERLIERAKTISREEIFGAVLTVIRAESTDQAIRIANDTEYGLSAEGSDSGDYVKAPIPVMARPTMSVCMVSVPSKVWIASRSTMCRMTW